MNNESREFIDKLKNLDIWEKEFENIDDLLDNFMLKSPEIPEFTKAVLSVIRTGDIIKHTSEKYFKKFGLTIAQKSILEALYFCGKEYLTQSQLSKFLYSSKSNISTILERMEEKKLIKREENPQNKREKKVIITKLGIESMEKLISSIKENVVDNVLTIEESKQLKKLLSKLRVNFKGVTENGKK